MNLEHKQKLADLLEQYIVAKKKVIEIDHQIHDLKMKEVEVELGIEQA